MFNKFIPSTSKLTAKLTYNQGMYFANEKKNLKKSNIYTSYIKIKCIFFSEGF